MKSHSKRVFILTCFLLFIACLAYSQRLLPNRTLVQYSVTQKGNAVELRGTLSASHTYSRIIVERGSSGLNFSTIAELPLGINSNATEYSFVYIDQSAPYGDNYYRIRLVNTDRTLEEISEIWMVKPDEASKDLVLYNTVLQSSNPMLMISSKITGEASLHVTSLSGLTAFHKEVSLNTGVNNFNISQVMGVKGYYLVTLMLKDKIITRQIVVQ